MSEHDACVNDTAVCGPFRNCVNACQSQSCIMGCENMYPGYHTLWDPLISCICTQCGSICPGGFKAGPCT